MRLIKYLFVALLGFALSANAQQKDPTQTLLWEISGKNLTKPSYLFGTYHFADKGFVDTMAVLNLKLAQADAVVGELIIDKDLPLKLMPFMMMKDTLLSTLLSADEYLKVANYLKAQSGYELKMFNTMKPMVVQTMIIQLNSPKTFTATNPALDEYFQNYGKAHQKEVFGLETVEDQAKVLFGASLKRQKEMLLKSVKNAEKEKKESSKIYQLYITQNLTGLAKIFNKNNGFSAAEMDNLLKNRNEKWLTQLPALMQKQSLFIAVGAGHLVGKDGLIKGLQTLGYTVKPVSTN